MSGFMGSGIPEHVVAYAAGMFTATHDETRLGAAEHVAAVLRQIGLGTFDPADLRAAALIWLETNVDRATVERWRARLRSGGVTQ